MTEEEKREGKPEGEDKSERVQVAEETGKLENDISTAVQDAVESSSDAVEDAVEAAEDAAESVVETILDESEAAAEKIGNPDLADEIAARLFAKFEAAGLTVSRVAEDAIEAPTEIADEVGDTVSEIVADVSDSISPAPQHPWYGPPSEFFRALRSKRKK